VKTARLDFRRWRESDLDAAREIYADPEVMRFIPVGPMNDEQILRMMARMNAEIDERGYGLWAVIDSGTGELLGESGLHYLPETDEIEIAWLFRVRAWGRGFASEAARAVLDAAWAQHGLRRVICLIDEHNHRSVRVAEKLGMRYVGVGDYYERKLTVREAFAPAASAPR
jgi:RimJ/RimL family protein N-acetyltransferase